MLIFGCGDITEHSPSIGASFYLEPRPARIRFSMSWPFRGIEVAKPSAQM